MLDLLLYEGKVELVFTLGISLMPCRIKGDEVVALEVFVPASDETATPVDSWLLAADAGAEGVDH